MKKTYVLIEVEEYLDDEMGEIVDPESLAGYLVNEFDNHHLLNGSVQGFGDLEDLQRHVVALRAQDEPMDEDEDSPSP